MRIGVLTFHRTQNCGALLQAWALKKILQAQGHQVYFPNCNSVGLSPRWQLSWTNPEKKGLRWLRALIGRSYRNLCSVPNEDILRIRYRRFLRRHIPTLSIGPEAFKDSFDSLIFGSDQIWNPKITHEDSDLYLGNTSPRNLPKIAYAASYGDMPLEGESLDRLISALPNFDKISVRERLASEQLSRYVTPGVPVTLDPTLLLTREDYSEIAHGPVPKEPYLFVYILSANDYLVNTAKALARRLNVKCVIAPCNCYSRMGSPSGMTYGVSPDRMVQLSQNAKYILASSFHGTVMGIVFKKPFLSLREQIDEFESRPASILNKLGLSDRLVNPTHTIEQMCVKMLSPLPEYGEKLSALREESIAWLKTALEET